MGLGLCEEQVQKWSIKLDTNHKTEVVDATVKVLKKNVLISKNIHGCKDEDMSIPISYIGLLSRQRLTERRGKNDLGLLSYRIKQNVGVWRPEMSQSDVAAVILHIEVDRKA